MSDILFPDTKDLFSENGKYKPGYDAKHVSLLLGTLKDDCKENGRKAIRVTDLRAAQKQLRSEALQIKLANAVERWNHRNDKPAKDTLLTDEGTSAVEDTPDTDAHTGEGYPATYEDGNGLTIEVIRAAERQDVKVGRWFYPAIDVVTDEGTAILRNTKKDMTGEWVVFSE